MFHPCLRGRGDSVSVPPASSPSQLRTAKALRQDLFNDAWLECIGELVLQPIAFEEEIFMMESELVQDRGMPVGNADSILNRREANIVGVAVADTRLNPAARHPERNPTWSVVAAGRLQVFPVAHLGDRKSTEFTSPDHKNIV